MDFHTAQMLAKQLEGASNRIVVSGVREESRGAETNWVIDLTNKKTGQATVLDEKDDWPKRIGEIDPQFNVAAWAEGKSKMVRGSSQQAPAKSKAAK